MTEQGVCPSEEEMDAEETIGRLQQQKASLLAACEHHIRELDSADSNRHTDGCECGSCAIRTAVEQAS